MNNSFIKKTAYGLLNLVTLRKGVGRVINGMKIKFPAKWSRYYIPDYEQENYTFLRQIIKPGIQIIDIGAHIGVFSVYTSKLTGNEGRVICAEPTPGTFAVLKETLRLNDCRNVIPLKAAIGNKKGKATFYISNFEEGCNSNSLVKNKPEKEASGYEVQVLSIDSIVSEYELKPSLIKIDVEGAELDALKGGFDTFQKYRPILMVGIHPDFILKNGDSLEAVWDQIILHGYKIRDGFEVPLTRDEFCSKNNLFEAHCRME